MLILSIILSVSCLCLFSVSYLLLLSLFLLSRAQALFSCCLTRLIPLHLVCLSISTKELEQQQLGYHSINLLCHTKGITHKTERRKRVCRQGAKERQGTLRMLVIRESVFVTLSAIASAVKQNDTPHSSSSHANTDLGPFCIQPDKLRKMREILTSMIDLYLTSQATPV